jgi:PIN domain nuclease of toxin-antitoxin system
MAESLEVKADVIDIRRSKPINPTRIMVDSQVWFWLFYSKASIKATAYQAIEYPKFIKTMLDAKSEFLASQFSYFEILHNIEKTEAFIKSKRTPQKVFRHQFPTARVAIIEETDATWASVAEMAKVVYNNLDAETLKRMRTKSHACLVDGYDYILIDAIESSGLSSVLTDDSDICTVAGLTVYTANPKAIVAATNQGRLIS